MIGRTMWFEYDNALAALKPNFIKSSSLIGRGRVACTLPLCDESNVSWMGFDKLDFLIFGLVPERPSCPPPYPGSAIVDRGNRTFTFVDDLQNMMVPAMTITMTRFLSEVEPYR